MGQSKFQWQNREALVIKRYKHKCIQTIEMSLCSNKSIHETSKHMMPCTKLLRPIQQIETNYITWPLNEIPLSLSTGIIGGAYGGTLGHAAKWDDLAEGSLTLSWETNTKVIDEHSVIEKTGTRQIRRVKRKGGGYVGDGEKKGKKKEMKRWYVGGEEKRKEKRKKLII